MATDSDQLEKEVVAIRARYARRTDDLAKKSIFHPHRLATTLEKQAGMVTLLRCNLQVPLSEARILEIGCGYGDNLLQFLTWGANPANLVGNELQDDIAAHAREVLPAATAVHVGDARTLALPPASFDIVMASTVFSSILDLPFRAALADHLWSLVKPGGGVLWYDFIFNNPSNSDVRKVTRRELRDLFPAARHDVRRMTLAPPIARRLAPISMALYRTAGLLPPLQTHLLGWLAKAADA